MLALRTRRWRLIKTDLRQLTNADEYFRNVENATRRDRVDTHGHGRSGERSAAAV
jgi:hypothetical protein